MSLWKAIRLLLTLHCEESTQLMSASLERELSAVERWAVRLHAGVCRSCRRFRRQLKFLQEAARRRADTPVQDTMPQHLRNQIRRELLPPHGNDA